MKGVILKTDDGIKLLDVYSVATDLGTMQKGVLSIVTIIKVKEGICYRLQNCPLVLRI